MEVLQWINANIRTYKYAGSNHHTNSSSLTRAVTTLLKHALGRRAIATPVAGDSHETGTIKVALNCA
jgi:hypothetical protein